MFNLWNRSKYGPIGVDIGAEGVRLLQLARSGGRYSVAAAARWHFPDRAGFAQADVPTRRRQAAEAVRDLVRHGRFHGRDAVSCLRLCDLSIKNIRLPHLSAEELSQAVRWEAQERFGFEVAPDRLFFANAGEVRQGNEVRDEVLLIGARAEAVQAHLDFLEQMRLRPLHLDAEPTALFAAYHRFLRRAQDESVVSVLVDLGLQSTKVVVARGATILLIKDIDLGGHKLNETVSKELNLDYDEAAHLRKRGGQPGAEGEPAGGADGSVDPVAWSLLDAVRGQGENLAREIGLCLRYCAVTFRGLRPSRVTLTGGEAYDGTLVKLLKESLDCECVVGEPLRGVDLGQADLGGDRRGLLTEWSVAMGLALRGWTDGPGAWKADHEPSRISA